MATDFFERQSLSRRYTRWLVALFTLAVLGIVTTTFFVTLTVIDQSQLGHVTHATQGRSSDRWQIPMLASGAALALILGGSLFKTVQLRGGGTVVAERLGGKRLYPDSPEPFERRILNIVEEMALASGVPVPPVYLLPQEQAINAFAAGYSPSDAVVAVTRGCVENLSREQLQGVVAHEFSHILNGDMRLNIRMIGILHGILLLSLLGRILLRSTAYRGRSRSRDDSGSALLLIGLAVLVLGYLGALIGNLIKAAVSRQREYLADASAVQFTRNPGGIAGALKQIGATHEARLTNPNASEASHLFFSTGVWEGFTGLMATHPPLMKRILAIEPTWDKKFPLAQKPLQPIHGRLPEGLPQGGPEGLSGLVGTGTPGGMELSVPLVEQAADQVGLLTEQHRQYAIELVQSLPDSVVAAAHEPYGARAVIFGLLLDVRPEMRKLQMEKLDQLAQADVVALTVQLTPSIDQVDIRARLPLIDLTLPALRAMAPSQYKTFSLCFQEMIAADQKIGLFEWALHRMLLRHLHPQFHPIHPKPARYYGLQRLAQPCSVLYSSLAYAGNQPQEALSNFEAARQVLPEVRLELLDLKACGLSQLDESLKKLQSVSVRHRRRLIDAAAATICADQEVRVREAELLRAISDMLDCPMPPLLPGQSARMS